MTEKKSSRFNDLFHVLFAGLKMIRLLVIIDDKIYTKPEELNFDDIGNTSELTVNICKEILNSCHIGDIPNLLKHILYSLEVQRNRDPSCENFHSGSNVAEAETSQLTVTKL